MKTVIEMAREAGLHEARENPPYFGASALTLDRLAELVRADEREAVLDLVDAYAKNSKDLAAAIRARGNT